MPATVAALRAAFGERVGRVRGRRRAAAGTGRGSRIRGRRVRRRGGDPAGGVRARPSESGLLWVARESHPGAPRRARALLPRPRRGAAPRRARSARWRARGGLPVDRGRGARTADGGAGDETLAEGGGRPPGRRGPGAAARPRARRGRSGRSCSRRFPGYGVAQVCRTCGAPAACATCGGMLRARPAARSGVWSARRRGGAPPAAGRRSGCVAAGPSGWRSGPSRAARCPVRARRDARGCRGGRARSLVGGPDAVRDLGVAGLDLVAILDADLAAARPGADRPRARARDLDGGGGLGAPGRSAIVQSAHPGDPAVQALVRGRPDRFHERERARRAEAGFPVGAPVFRVIGTDELERRGGGARADHVARHVARRPDGMLARARARPGPGLRGRDAALGRRGGRRARRSRTALCEGPGCCYRSARWAIRCCVNRRSPSSSSIVRCASSRRT